MEHGQAACHGLSEIHDLLLYDLHAGSTIWSRLCSSQHFLSDVDPVGLLMDTVKQLCHGLQKVNHSSTDIVTLLMTHLHCHMTGGKMLLGKG